MAASCPRPVVSSRVRPFTFSLIATALLFCVCAVQATAATLGGRVLDPSGTPVADAVVIVDGPVGVRTARTDTDGRFQFTHLPDARYRVFVELDGFTAAPEVVRLDAERGQDIELRLRLAPLAESIVVAAAPVPRPTSESPASVTVVTREEIAARQLETVADILRATPGFSVGRNGGRGALTSLFPRGGESDYTLVLVDGMRLNGFGGGLDLGLLPFADVEQVEIVRGPQSAVFGSDAIGGIVHLTTRHGGPPSAGAQVEGGGQSTVRVVGGVRGAAGRWSFGAGGERNQTDGFTGIAPATGEHVSNDDWDSSTLNASIGWTKSAATAVRADLRWLDSERGNPGPFGSNPIGAYTAVDRIARGANTHRQAGLQGRIPWSERFGGRIEQRFQVTTADLDNRFTSSFGDSFFETRRISGRTQTDAILTPTTGLSAGFEALSERARGTYLTGESFQQIPIERLLIGGFAEVRQDLGNRASLTAGLRIDDIRRQALEGDPNPFGARPAFPLDAVTSANPRGAFRAVVWQDARGLARTTVRASVGSGIRAPDAFETAFTDNPSLQPERSRSVDVGVTHLLVQGMTVDATLFLNRFDDLIVAVGRSFQDASRYRTDNISNARARGVELAGAWRHSLGVTARAAYTFLDSEILAVDQSADAPPPFKIGDPLIRRPRHQAALDLGWTRGAFAAFSQVRTRGSVLDIEPSFGASGGLFTAPGFTVIDAGASWRVHKYLEAFARGLNLLDRRYEEAYGYPAPGRLGMVGLRVAVRP